MIRWDYRDGDLIRNRHNGALRQVVGEQFTKRFMDAEDHEMVAHGMGHMAGSYGGAIRTMALDDTEGRLGKGTYTMKIGNVRQNWENLTADEETANEDS